MVEEKSPADLSHLPETKIDDYTKKLIEFLAFGR
jgi:hypothetical protein